MSESLPNRKAGNFALVTLLGGGAWLALTAHDSALAVNPPAAEPLWARAEPAGELVGPPYPLPNPQFVFPPAPYDAGPPTVGGTAGRIGFMGPIEGPLDAGLGGIMARGPIWSGAPLPRVGANGALTEGGEPLSPEEPDEPAGSSELPDAGKLALAHLANPGLAPRPAAGAPIPAPPTGPDVSAEKPLNVQLTFNRSPKGHDPGATIAVRLSASAAAHFVVIGVDGRGKATTLGRSGSAVRSYGLAVRAQEEPGPQYLLALASVNPLNGADAAIALRANGTGWLSPVVTVANEAAAPGAAWATAAQLAQTLGGAAKGWKRFEYAIAAGSFAVRPPARVATEGPGEGDKPAPKAPADGSLLPSAKPAESARPVP